MIVKRLTTAVPTVLLIVILFSVFLTSCKKGAEYYKPLDIGELKKLAVDDAQAQFELAERYYNGEGVGKDLSEAVKLYRKAADKKLPRAQTKLGNCIALGEGIPESEIGVSKALVLWRAAADKKEPEAEFQIAVCYYTGTGVEEDLEESFIWMRRSVEHGYTKAFVFLGEMYYNGEGTDEDLAEAFKWYQKGAENKDAHAQYATGILYLKGKGVGEDEAKALKWLEMAAEQGHEDAQYITAMMYYNGDGTGQNYTEAVKWFELAAAQGNKDACSQLALCYFYGQGVYEDYKESYYWLKRSGPSKNATIAGIETLLEYKIPVLERIKIHGNAVKDMLDIFAKSLGGDSSD